jgi:hypothetical protein
MDFEAVDLDGQDLDALLHALRCPKENGAVAEFGRAPELRNVRTQRTGVL